jgi:OPA family glycerol-3-phosphate transporter-like MFS transporter/OPA family sugar phosphate sensor protein UhpC-like MFS transporter
VLALGAIWMLNGWFQGMGFPPCARLMTHWFPPKKLATKMSLWNISHSLGAGIIVVSCGYLVPHGWRLCFFVPAGIALVCSLYLWLALPDTPEAVGLPEVEGTRAGADEEGGNDFRTLFFKYVFGNKYIWLLAAANFFVYIIRYAVLDWGPTLLTEAKGIEITNAAWMVFAFEISGLSGMLLAGWITDRFFGGRSMRTCFFYMVLAGISLALFWKISGQSRLLATLFLCSAGFFIYGPQALVGIAAANLATKRAAATASGFTGYFGYLSTLLSGWGLGVLVQTRGWDAAFKALLIVAAVGALLFALGWKAHAHGYKEAQ